MGFLYDLKEKIKSLIITYATPSRTLLIIIIIIIEYFDPNNVDSPVTNAKSR